MLSSHRIDGVTCLRFDPQGWPYPPESAVESHCWWRIESGKAKSITDLAEQEHVTPTYVTRILALTGLAPDIAIAILDGRQPR